METTHPSTINSEGYKKGLGFNQDPIYLKKICILTFTEKDMFNLPMMTSSASLQH